METVFGKEISIFTKKSILPDEFKGDLNKLILNESIIWILSTIGDTTRIKSFLVNDIKEIKINH